MSELNVEFENFLKEEANRYFKAPPNESEANASQLAQDREHRDIINDVVKPEVYFPYEIGNSSVDRLSAGHSNKRSLSHIASGHENHGSINPPVDFTDSANFGGSADSSLTEVGGIGGKSVKSSGNGLLYDPARLTLPYQERYEQPIIELSERLKGGHSFTHGAQFPVDNQESAYYFLAENPFKDHLLTEGIDSSVKNVTALDVGAIRADFPILNESVNGHPLIWLDNAATTQKPQVVIDRLAYFYAHENSNIHRAAHKLAARATDAYEEARNVVKDFLNASSANEIVFTRGTTEAINLVASSWGEENIGAQDEIILSNLEHHANIVPWQLLSQRKGFKIRVIPVDDAGDLLLDEYTKILSPKTKLVSFTHVSNALGTVTPAKQIIDLAHQAGAKVLLDGAQSVSHMRIDLQYLNPDFFVFSGHKVFGPTGIGVLYGKEELLNRMQPYQGGGNMIKDVRFDQTTYHDAPNRFEAGTGNIADAVGLAAALRYVQGVGLEGISAYEHYLLAYASNLLQQLPGITLIGTAQHKASVLSFTINGIANDEVGAALNEVGIAVRTGHHCAQPILRRLGHESTVRPSLAFYNTCQEIDFLIHTLEQFIWQRKRYY
ncbi:cysteine desulfurase [Sphingobacterium sp. lm-10]|uniref:family 2A encapsulin nanocompartment cargo protein cysteine desulfurase n=1 Tax=Sphingobacterium sp. lm-10 TaxID=2944904 RepID=UPI00201FD883|nr:family 2A encapsulin nanocompartment cargo protein cysteine desulfurase [Sphingobacterium sp. lm-10]MCL7987258.1 cysteine desulfurase [Sphingobacterium sp. lm-10]